MEELIYVCSPFNGDIQHNTEYALEICGDMLEYGLYPVCSHPTGKLVYGVVSEEAAMDYCKALLRCCKYLYNPLPIRTNGMLDEIELAKKLGITIIEGVGIEELWEIVNA